MPFRKDRSGITLKLYPLSLLAGRAAGLRQDDGQRLAATAPLNASFLGGRDLCTEGIERLRLVGALELESKFLPRSLLGRSLEERLGNFVVTCTESELAELVWLQFCSGYGELLYWPVSGTGDCSRRRRGIQVNCAGGPLQNYRAGADFFSETNKQTNQQTKNPHNKPNQTQASQAVIVAAQRGVMALISRIVI